MENIEILKLPSNGLVGDTPKEVNVRNMKGKELSTLYSSLTEAAIDKVISDVTTPSLEPNTLCDQDKSAILHMSRVLTFGQEVEQTLRCPFCGKIDTYTLDYEDFPITLLDDTWMSSAITMPDGKVITKRIPTKADWDVIYRHKEKRNLDETYAFILLQASKIAMIDGKAWPIGEVIGYLENLPGKDLMYLVKELDVKFGIDTTFTVECKVCHSDFTGGLGINADLFR